MYSTVLKYAEDRLNTCEHALKLVNDKCDCPLWNWHVKCLEVHADNGRCVGAAAYTTIRKIKTRYFLGRQIQTVMPTEFSSPFAV